MDMSYLNKKVNIAYTMQRYICCLNKWRKCISIYATMEDFVYA